MATAPWTNADGLQVKFGNYYRDPSNFVNRARAVSLLGPVKVIEVDFDLSKIASGAVSYTVDLNNDGTLDGFSDEDPRLPANASVLRATVVMNNTAAGGTSFTVGTYRQTGAAVAATGLVTATEGVLANINGAGKRVFGAGALTSATAGTAGTGANNVYIGISPTGTFTAGAGKLIVEYIDPLPEAAVNT